MEYNWQFFFLHLIFWACEDETHQKVYVISVDGHLHNPWQWKHSLLRVEESSHHSAKSEGLVNVSMNAVPCVWLLSLRKQNCLKSKALEVCRVTPQRT